KLERRAAGDRKLAVLDAAGQSFDLLPEFGHLELDRAWVERIEHQQVDVGVAAARDIVAATMGHDAVADLEQHVERAVGRVVAREPARDAGDLDAALETPADLE